MKRWLGWLRHPSVLITLAVLTLILGWQLWNGLAAGQRMSQGVQAALASGEDPLAVVVQVDFKIEPYHTQYFQQQGRIARAREGEVWLRAVPASRVTAMARNYWITRIQLESETNP
jgi:hypothetical protein